MENILHNLELYLTIALSKQLLIRAIKIAIVVGIVLNMINQGDLIVNLDFENVNYLKMGFTFCVPFCVSMYTAITMKLKFQVGEQLVTDVILKCKGCNQCMKLKQKEIIPFCKKCKDKTEWQLTSEKDKKCQQYN